MYEHVGAQGSRCGVWKCDLGVSCSHLAHSCLLQCWALLWGHRNDCLGDKDQWLKGGRGKTWYNFTSGFSFGFLRRCYGYGCFCKKSSVKQSEKKQHSYASSPSPPRQNISLISKKYPDYEVWIEAYFQVFSSGTFICMLSLICQVSSAEEASECSLVLLPYEVSSMRVVLVLSFDGWGSENAAAPSPCVQCLPALWLQLLAPAGPW